MPTLTKLLRTVIGLPVVLAIWPFAIAIGLVVFICQAINGVVRWVLFGEFRPWLRSEREQEDRELFWATRIIVLPYQFVRHIWKS